MGTVDFSLQLKRPHKMLRVTLLCTAITACLGQNVGHEKKNVNPPLQLEECTGKEECTVVKTKVTMDQNWRWVHDVNGYENCYTGNQWDSGKCPDPETCSRNCAVDGIDDVSQLGCGLNGAVYFVEMDAD